MDLKQNPSEHDRRSFHRYVLGGMGVAVASPFATDLSAAEPEKHPQSCVKPLRGSWEGMNDS